MTDENIWAIVILSFSLFFTGYFLLSGLIYFLFKAKSGKWPLHKLQSASQPMHGIWREIKYSVSSIIVFAFVGALNYLLYLQGYTQIYTEVGKFGTLYLIVSFFLSLLIHDFYFYWTHRLLHLPGVFTKIHKTHHRSHNPSSFAALSFHPVEALIQAGIVPFLCVLLPLHPLVISGFIFYSLLANIIGHAGYEFFSAKFKSSFLGRISNTPLYHNSHHQFVKGNYGLYLNIWDSLMGTCHKHTKGH